MRRKDDMEREVDTRQRLDQTRGEMKRKKKHTLDQIE